MYAYLKTVGKAIENRFPELEFITNNFSFIDPKQRKLCHCDIQLVVKKFANDNEMNFNKTTLYKQYRNYSHDTTLDFLFEVTSSSNPVKFLLSYTKMMIIMSLLG